jgi:hypothetical protein
MYTGQSAVAIATEARLLVALKGGIWRESSAGEAVANAVAVRGLDLELGLKGNSNRTYDDTLFVVVEAPGAAVEAYEYRLTTESSSTRRGVGRLDSKQVKYLRGLHKGKDPAYRLLGDKATGTRVGREGTYEILGANIHSAYTSQEISSETPLATNVSLGCQVVAASKRAFEKSLVSLLDSKRIKEFPYMIVDDEELALVDRSLRANGKASVLVAAVPRIH